MIHVMEKVLDAKCFVELITEVSALKTIFVSASVIDAGLIEIVSHDDTSCCGEDLGYKQMLCRIN